MAETTLKNVWEWQFVEELISSDDFNEFRDEMFCCSRIKGTEKKKYACRLCATSVTADDEHTMTERRLECISPACPFMWRVFSCEKASIGKVHDNNLEHKRAIDSGCGATHNPRITDEMKEYIMEQDNANQQPRMILVNMKESSAITKKPDTWPSLKQVQNCVKYLKRRYGTKNSIRAVRKMVRVHHYHSDLPEDSPMIFGAEEDEEGFARFGDGDGDDPFLLGVTTPGLVNASIKFAQKGPDAVFHMDATYKLSDLGYRTVTCGFTDAARSYQLSAIIVISTQTAEDYESCLKALVKVFKRVQPEVSLEIQRFMGDGDHAQLNAMAMVPEFSSASYLMCFFHVLYNVRKKTRHLTDDLRRVVMDGIVDMHYAESESKYEEVKRSVMAWWWTFAPLRQFAEYFQKQWLHGKFNHWQIWHTSYGLATTNNPCETFNATLKVYSGRRRHHMQKLLAMFFKVVKNADKLEPKKASDFIPASREVKDAAKKLLKSGRLVVRVSRSNGSVDDGVVLVKHQSRAESTQSDEDDLMKEFRAAIDGGTQQSSETSDSDTVDPDDILSAATLARAEKEKAAKVGQNIVKWALLRAHMIDMPPNGWKVNIRLCSCECQYYMKFKSCCHVVLALQARKRSIPGDDGGDRRLVSQRTRQASSTSGAPPAPRAPPVRPVPVPAPSAPPFQQVYEPIQTFTQIQNFNMMPATHQSQHPFQHYQPTFPYSACQYRSYRNVDPELQTYHQPIGQRSIQNHNPQAMAAHQYPTYNHRVSPDITYYYGSRQYSRHHLYRIERTGDRPFPNNRDDESDEEQCNEYFQYDFSSDEDRGGRPRLAPPALQKDPRDRAP